MEQTNLSELTDEQLLLEAKQLKSFSIMNAFIIGFLVGIVLFSIYFSAYTIALLIPLFLIYKITNDPKNKRAKELQAILKERNIK
ncbi:hypothetical protein [Pedobacter aquatilis]|uniref:hypothetical protein n=1 Tax=Pedobacter aquatilis TaxID=351343 RepID=UPI00292E20E2|nr:hypothetical protein [Pedobacter aquatilis]